VTDNQTEGARTSLELLDSVPESLLRRVKQYSGRLATEAVHVMGDRLPFFADLEASQRASVQLVVQTALVNFAEWMRNPRGDVGYTAEAFALVPQELTRRIAHMGGIADHEDLGVAGYGVCDELTEQQVACANAGIVATEAVVLNSGPLRFGLLRALVRGLGKTHGVSRNDTDGTRNTNKPSSELHTSHHGFADLRVCGF